MPESNSFFENLDHGLGRSTTINWDNQLKRIVDDYETHTTISHGVQKDAIQNGWDARTDKKKGKSWGMRFELRDNGQGSLIVVFTDWGTTGLTGRVLKPEELEKTLPSEERWGRFENMAFTKDPDEETLGARGQGKFIFLAASKQKRIVYDTLRKDGVYRLGVKYFRGIIDIKSHSWENDKAREKLSEFAPSLSPLEKIGTRIIIDDPIDELVGALKDKTFHRSISTTWWEIIVKFDAQISIVTDDQEEFVKAPDYYLDKKYLPKGSKTYEKENQTISVLNNLFRIKKLYLVYSPTDEMPEDIRGIAIQRGGMMIERRKPPYLPKAITNKIFGYICFDRNLDQEMAKQESSTHYTFSWRKRFPRSVKEFYEKHISDFAKEVGLIPNPEGKKNRLRKEAEKKALFAANRLAKALGISGKGYGGKGGGGKGGGGKRSSKLISITFSDLETHSGNLRVEHGESINNILCKVINNTNEQIEVFIRVFVTFGRSDLIHTIIENSIRIDPGSTHDIDCGNLTIDQSLFNVTGKYFIRGNLVNLMNSPPKEIEEIRKGKIIDKDAKAFWVAEDPPIGGLWEDVVAVSWNRDPRLGEYNHGASGGYIYYYNVKHGAYEALNGDEETKSEYIYRLLVHAVAEIDLDFEEPELFEKNELHEPGMVARRIGLILGEALHTFYNE